MEPDPIMLETGPLSESLLAELTERLVAFHPTWQTVQWLRGEYPHIRFILCSEDDMAEREPYQTHAGFDIHLMAGGLGCACLTDSIEKSVGLVVALHEEACLSMP